LLSGQININKLSLIGADINLIVDPNGNNNWQANADTRPSAQNNDPLGSLIENSVNDTGNASDQQSAADAFDLANLTIEDFSITNSRVSYEDAQKNVSQLIEGINLDINLADQNKNISLDGNVMWQKQKINFNLDQFNIENFVNAQDTKLALKINSTLFNAELAGNIRNADRLIFNGNAMANSESIHKLSNWLDIHLSDVNDSAFNLNSGLKISGDTYQLTNLALTAYDSVFNANLTIANGDVPDIYGKISANQINYNRIIVTSDEEISSNSWSTKPIKLGFLSKINSNIDLDVGKFSYKNIIADQLITRITIRKSTATIPLKVNVFGGSVASVSGNKSGLNISSSLKLTNINIGDTLKEFDISDKLEATTNLKTTLTTRGNSVADFMNNLKGSGNIEMLDGVIKGIAFADALAPEIANIDLSLNSPEKIAQFALKASKSVFGKQLKDKMAGNFNQGVGTDKQTKFVKATFSYVINQGVLNNKDLEIASENIIIRGEGNVDLGKKSLKYRIVPKLLRKVNDGTSERMTVPVLISGDWANPKIDIDYTYALENSSMLKKIRADATKKVTDKVVNIVKQQLGEKVGNLLDENVVNQIGGLLGLKPADKTSNDVKPDDAKTKDPLDPQNLLNNLFGTATK
ncbi:MAG: AsmA family protein, partial [Rhizobiales bacterium]|nr:AsmA family protein [Hyphomicrobiales bacterium]